MVEETGVNCIDNQEHIENEKETEIVNEKENKKENEIVNEENINEVENADADSYSDSGIDASSQPKFVNINSNSNENEPEPDCEINFNEEEKDIDDLLDKYTEGNEQDEAEDENNNQNENETKKSQNNLNKKKLKKELRKKFEENIYKYFINSAGKIDSEGKKENTNNPLDNDLFVYTKLKKLKKKSEVEKEKRLSKKVSMGFFDVEAELGSDNEEHDDEVKHVKDSDEEEDENLDQDLKDLIAEDDNPLQDAEAVQQKYFDDMLDRDRAEVKRVIHGPEKVAQLKVKRARSADDIADEDLPLQLRMKRYQTEKEENDPQFDLKVLFNKIKTIQEKLTDADDEENEELNEMYQSIENKMIKKLAEKEKKYTKVLLTRIKENDKILENVINLNGDNRESDKAKLDKFFISGTNSNSNITAGISTNSNSITMNPISSLSISMGRQTEPTKNTPTNNNKNIHKYGAFYNHNNSFLHAMKNDKYYTKTESLSDLNYQNSSETNPNPNPNPNSNSTVASNSNQAGNIKNKSSGTYSIFSNKNSSLNNNLNSNKSSNLSSLFTQSNKNRHTDSNTFSRKNNFNNNTPIKDKTSSLKKLLNS